MGSSFLGEKGVKYKLMGGEVKNRQGEGVQKAREEVGPKGNTAEDGQVGKQVDQ